MEFDAPIICSRADHKILRNIAGWHERQAIVAKNRGDARDSRRHTELGEYIYAESTRRKNSRENPSSPSPNVKNTPA